MVQPLQAGQAAEDRARKTTAKKNERRIKGQSLALNHDSYVFFVRLDSWPLCRVSYGLTHGPYDSWPLCAVLCGLII